MITLLVMAGLVGNAALRQDPAAAIARSCQSLQRGTAIDLIGTRYAPEQAREPQIALGEIDARQSMLLLPDGRFMVRTSTVYPGGIEFRFRTVGTLSGEETIDELGWRDGDALLGDDAKAAAKDLADYRMLVPGLLACMAPTAAQAADRERAWTAADGRAVRIRLNDDGNIAEAAIGNELYRYEDWRSADGVMGPRLITRTREGHVVAKWSDVRLLTGTGADVDEALLKVPTGYRAADATGELRATPLGQGVYRIDGTPSGYHTGFVVGDRSIAIFDAPVGIEEAKSVRAMIEKIAPGRRIAHIVVSHVHGDHVAGLPGYPEAEVITGPGGTTALRRQFPALSEKRIKELDGETSIDLGGRVIEIYPFSSSHSTTMLVGYDLTSRTLFQGDLFYIPERGAVPPAFATGEELQQLIRRQRLKVGLIVGVHGRSGTNADLDQALILKKRQIGDRGGVGYQFSRGD